MKISIILTMLTLLLVINTNIASALTRTDEKINIDNKSYIQTYIQNRIASDSGKDRVIAEPKTTPTAIERFKQKANNEIARRVTSLNKNIAKISEIKKLTESQKSSLTSDIQSEITNLTELNNKIQTETSVEILRTDVKSIVSSHKTYLLFLPKTQIIIVANGLLNTADKLSELGTKLQTRIDEAGNKGEDVSVMKTTLTDVITKITEAKTQANNAIATVFALQPANYPDNKPELQSARAMLQTAHKDLTTAKQKAQEIIVALKKLNNTNETKPSLLPSLSPINRKSAE